MDACIYSNLLTKIFLRACLFRWDPDCCKSRYQGGTCSYSNLETKNVLNSRLLYVGIQIAVRAGTKVEPVLTAT